MVPSIQQFLLTTPCSVLTVSLLFLRCVLQLTRWRKCCTFSSASSLPICFSMTAKILSRDRKAAEEELLYLAHALSCSAIPIILPLVALLWQHSQQIPAACPRLQTQIAPMCSQPSTSEVCSLSLRDHRSSSRVSVTWPFLTSLSLPSLHLATSFFARAPATLAAEKCAAHLAGQQHPLICPLLAKACAER